MTRWTLSQHLEGRLCWTAFSRWVSVDGFVNTLSDFNLLPQVGEGTFAEVFATAKARPRWGNTVAPASTAMAFKVMPLGGDVKVNGEPQKTPDEMLAEVAATLRLGELAATTAPSFIRAMAVTVCRGAYPTQLVQAWFKWRDENEDACENDPPVWLRGKAEE